MPLALFQCPALVDGQVYHTPDGTQYLYLAGKFHGLHDARTFEALHLDWGSSVPVTDTCVAAVGADVLPGVGDAGLGAVVHYLQTGGASAPTTTTIYEAAPGGGVVGRPPDQLGVSVQSGGLHAGLNLSGVTSFFQQHSTLLLLLGAGYVASQLGLIGGGGGGRRHRGLL